MTDAGHLRERVASGWDHLAELVESLGPQELGISGADGWAVKDHLAHMRIRSRIFATRTQS